MAKQELDAGTTQAVTREDLVALLNEDLAREYQAIISYVVYSQTLKGAEYMNIAAELETHAAEELAHALIIAGQIDYLGGMPLAVPKPVKTSAKAEDMLRFDLDNENETIRHYRQRVRQCEALGEYALAEHIRDILVQEQDHQIALANALGVDIPNVTRRRESPASTPGTPWQRRVAHGSFENLAARLPSRGPPRVGRRNLISQESGD